MTLMDTLQLVFGVALLLAGGESLVRGGASLARQLGVSPLVVGLTVLAFGTSAPELAVNVTAAIRGDGAVAFGNVMGSNLANVGLILGVTALVHTLLIEGVVVSRELPMMLLASAAALVLGFDSLLGTEQISRYDRADGIMLLLLFTVFLYYTVAETLRKRGEDPVVAQAREQEIGKRLGSLGSSAAFIGVGLLGLVMGGRFTVAGAVAFATALGVTKGLIGLTVVAVGTSLPELSASLLAVRRGETDLAVGNVVGSNIFNQLFVLGVTATIRPVPVPQDGQLDLVAVLGMGCVVLLASFRRRGLDRRAGAGLLALYFGYVGWRALSAVQEAAR